MTKMENPIAFSRRSIMKGGGALVVSLGMPMGMNTLLAINSALAQDARPPLTGDQLSTYIAVNADGTVTGFFGKMDMGHGITTAISQMIAEELDVPFKAVKLILADTALTINQGGASGSNGIQNGGKQLAVAAAEARRVLVEMAATKLNIPAEQLTVVDGVVSLQERSVEEGDLCRADRRPLLQRRARLEQADRQCPLCAGQAKIKKPSEHKIVGQSVKRTDVAPKAFATAGFVTDVKRDGMVHARMIRPPVAGSVPVKIDEASLKDIPGAKVVQDKGFLAVVADKEWDAIKASQALKVEWSQVTPPFPDEKALYDHIRKTPVRKREIDDKTKAGDVDEAFKNAARVIEAEYEWPFQSHACMGPACAVAEIKDGQATRVDRLAEDALRARRRGRHARNAGGQGARHLGHRPGLLRPQRCRRRRHGCRPHRRRRPAARRACNTPANRAPAGTRRAPPPSTRCALRSMLPARSSPMNSSARVSPAWKWIPTRASLPPRWRGN